MFYKLKKIILIFFLLINLTNPLYAFAKVDVESILKEKIINKLSKINNLVFNFKQIIGEKSEEGTCSIEYPKKIFCSYNNVNKKIIVSNGKSLVIKNQSSNKYYLYPLKKTPLELILDKDYLINQIAKTEGRFIDNKYLNYTLVKNNNKINIFFDNKTLNLIGWQTEDVYQNLVMTYIYKIEFNKKLDKKIFILPRMN